jgi:hypothetical protein
MNSTGNIEDTKQVRSLCAAAINFWAFKHYETRVHKSTYSACYNLIQMENHDCGNIVLFSFLSIYYAERNLTSVWQTELLCYLMVRFNTIVTA